MRYKKYLFILCVLLLAVILFIVYGVLQFLSKDISVQNKDSKYSVTYQKTDTFSNTLDQMGLWRKGSIFLAKDRYGSVRNLQVVFTNIPQPAIRHLDVNNRMLWSSNTEFKNGTLTVLIYLSPELLNDPFYLHNKDRNLDKLISIIVLRSVFASLTTDIFHGESVENLPQSTIATFMKRTDTNPFHITFD